MAGLTSIAVSPHGHAGEHVLAHSKDWRVSRHEVVNGAQVVTISNFLPPPLAIEWHASMNRTWEESSGCRADSTLCTDHTKCSWLYTTNGRGGNAKLRSVFKQAERRQEVLDFHRRGSFAYSKWELSAAQPLYKAVGDLMDSPPVRASVARVLGLEDGPTAPALGNISDYFVTAYDGGDFLSTHTDGASGSLAWVLHLAPGSWDGSTGGALRFSAGTVAGARDFAPGFNRMLLFVTRPAHVPHQVLAVKADGNLAEPRFGLTGWYMTRTDKMSAAIKSQLNLMRSESTRTNLGDKCV